MIRVAVRRPVATLTATAAMAAIGAASLFRMPLELLPPVELPRLEVGVSWPGASPEAVESLVTSAIEAEARAVRGVESVASTSYPERASVTVEFARGTDMEFARLELAERLAMTARSFPPGAGRPSIAMHAPEEFAEERQALLGYTLAGPSTLTGLRELALERVEPRIRGIEGVDAVDVVGGSDLQLEVRLDPERTAAHSLAPVEVRRAIATGLNTSESGATLRRGDREQSIVIDDRADHARDVAALVLRPAAPDSPALRLGDVAEVILASAEPRSLYRVDGVPALSLLVHSEAGSNEIRLADRVRTRIAELARELPSGFRLIEDYDRTEKIRTELARLRQRALVAAAVVLLVLLVAFGRAWPAMLAFGSIPVSILVAAALLWARGFSLNLLTLAGLAMGLGLVVDNAIVVLEAIETRRARGAPPAEAAVRAARQVALPILAGTSTTLIVFVPFLYSQGELRAYYVPFAWTVAAVLAVSLSMALTTIPSMAARIDASRKREPEGEVEVWGKSPRAEAHSAACRALIAMISWTVRHPKLLVGAVTTAFVLSGWLFWERVPRARAWGTFGDETHLSVQVEMPRGSELDHTHTLVRGLEERLAQIPEVKRYVAHVQPEFGHIRVTFPESLASTRIPMAIKDRIVAHAHHFGGAQVRVYGLGPSFYGDGIGQPTYSLELLGYDYRELERLALDLAFRLRRFARIQGVDSNASAPWFRHDGETELVLTPDIDRLAAHSLSVAEFIGRVPVSTHGRTARDLIQLAGEELPLDVKLMGAREADVEDLLETIVAGPGGRLIRTGDLAAIRPRETLGAIVREDQQYQRVVAWEFRGPPKLGDRVRDAVVGSAVLPAGYEIEVGRTWREYEKGEMRQLALVTGLAVVLIYLVTAALFESMRAPLVVLAAVPLALIGIFVLYWALGETFTREAWIGIIMMCGIVVNNAILVVDRVVALGSGANGPALPARQAALEGTLERVRPVLMTTATTVLGLLPLVLGAGEGTSTLWRALALTTIGGLVASTTLVLLTIPALYVLLAARTAVQGTHPGTACAPF